MVPSNPRGANARQHHGEEKENARYPSRDLAPVPLVQDQLLEKLKVRLQPVLKCRLQGWSLEDRQDIMQDTLTVFLEKMGSINSNPHMYTFKILKNKIGNALQTRQKRVDIPIVVDEDKNPEKHGIAPGKVLSTGETENDVLNKLNRKIAIEKY